jgi:hypothetical protein
MLLADFLGLWSILGFLTGFMVQAEFFIIDIQIILITIK